MSLVKIFTIVSFFILVCMFNISANAFEKDTSYTTYQTWEKIQKNYPDVKIVYAVQDRNLISEENVVYKTILAENGVQRELHLDIFRPEKNGKYPALIMIHGGGWRSGNKSMEKPMAQRIALNGYVTIPVEYRLS